MSKVVARIHAARQAWLADVSHQGIAPDVLRLGDAEWNELRDFVRGQPCESLAPDTDPSNKRFFMGMRIERNRHRRSHLSVDRERISGPQK